MSLAIPTTSFTCDVVDGLAHIAFNQPDRGNPVDAGFCRELSLAMAELSEREDVRAVLISARGKLFSVGGDIAAFKRRGTGLAAMIKHWTADLHAAIVRMKRMRAPVVAAVHGHVAGGSVSLMAAADLVVIGTSARITSAFTRIGFSPDTGSTMTLTARMGPARAKRFFCSPRHWMPMPHSRPGWSISSLTMVMCWRKRSESAGSWPRVRERLMAQSRSCFCRRRTARSKASSRMRPRRLPPSREGIKAFHEKRNPNFQGR